MPANLSRLIRLTPSARSDRDLLRAHLDGTDPTAFDELVHRHAGLAKRAAAEVCPAAAEDAAQTALALLARNAAAVASRESAAGWVFQTARRLALKARTAAARRSAREAQAIPPQSPSDPLDTLTLREVRAAVAEELARLPDDLRLPLVLCYWDGSTRPEAAARLGCSLSTLMRRLDAGRDRLAARLARRGFAGSAVLAALTVVQAGADAAIPVARSAVAGFAPWNMLSVIVVAASIVASGIGIGVSAPISADTPSQPEKPVAPPPAEIAQPRPALDHYGDPLPEGAITRFGTVRFRHGRGLKTIAYSPDGKTIATGGFDQIRLWDSETGKLIAPLTRKGQVLRGDEKAPETERWHGLTFELAFTLNGKELISVGAPRSELDEGHLLFWNLAGRKLTSSPRRLDDFSQTLSVSPIGKMLAVGTRSGTLEVINSETHAIQWTKKVEGSVAALSFAPDGKTLAVATTKDFVILFDVTAAIELKRILRDNVRKILFAPDGKSLWIGGGGKPAWMPDKQPGTIIRWDLQTATEVQRFETAPGKLSSLAASPDGKTLASGGELLGPCLWDVGTGKAIELETGLRMRTGVEEMAFAPDGKTLAVADSEGRVRVWDVATRRELHQHEAHTSWILSPTLSPDGTFAATSGWDGIVRIWDVTTGKAVRSWSADEIGSVNAIVYTPDGQSLLTAGWNGTVRLWDAATGKEIRRFRNDPGYARAALSPDGRLVAATGQGEEFRSITLYETSTGRPIRDLKGHISILSLLMFSPDGQRLVSAADTHQQLGGPFYDDRTMRVWDVATGRQIHKIEIGRPGYGGAISPDGRVIAVGIYRDDEKAESTRFWNIVTGQELSDRRIKDSTWPAFSPNGRYLATATDDEIQLIEVASGRVVRVFQSGAGIVNGLTFTPDGKRLVSAHDDSTALVWDVTPMPLANAHPTMLWDMLASDNARAAHQAAWALAADPFATVRMLGEKLKPVPKPAERRTTATLIGELDSPDFQTREAASRDLSRRVELDSAELTAALAKSPSAEARQRLTEILRSAPGPWPKLNAENLRRVRAVGVLEAIGTPEARRVLKALADGDPYAMLTRTAQAASRRLGE